MKHTARILFGACAGAAATIVVVTAYPSGWWPAQCRVMTEPLAKALFEEWNAALQQTPEKVVQTYTLDAVLLPTFENGPLIGRNEIRGYFDHFLEKHPVGRIDTRAIIPAGCDTGIVAGLYTFTVDKKVDGQNVRVDEPARYTYVYDYKQDVGRWLIAHHHSSAQPQKDAPR